MNKQLSFNQYIIETLLANYDLGILRSFVQVGGWSDISFLVETQKGKFFLKFFRLIRKTEKRIDFSLSLLSYLLELGFPVHETIRTKNEDLTFKVQVLGQLMVAIFNFLPGEQKKYGEIERVHLQELGRTLRHLHKALKGFPKEKLIEFQLPAENFSQEVKQIGAQLIGNFSENYFCLPAREINFLEQAWAKDYKALLDLLPKFKVGTGQLIHADFTPENIIFLDNKISGILDFDEVRIGLRLEDLATTTGAWFLSATPLNVRTVIGEILKNYKENYSLDEQKFVLNLIRFYIWKQISWARGFRDRESFLTFERKYKELSLLKYDDIFTN